MRGRGMANPSRVTSVVLLSLATALLLISLVTPWWEFERRTGRGWEEYVPFSTDEKAPAGEFGSETRILGFLVFAALPFSVVSLVLACMRLARPERRVGSMVLFGAIAWLLTAAALLYVFFAFPAEARQVRGEGFEGLGFWGEQCATPAGGDAADETCARTRAARGWVAGLAGGVALPVAGWIAAAIGNAPPRAQRAKPAPPPREPAPELPVKTVIATPERAVPAGYKELVPARTSYVKCPQCQTRLAFARSGRGPTLVRCHNCGKRMRA